VALCTLGGAMYTLGWSQDHPELGKNNFYTLKKKKCVVDP